MTCGQCGTENPSEARFCLNCGTRFPSAEAPRVEAETEPGGASLRAAVERMVADRAAAEVPSAPPWFAELGGRSAPAPTPPMAADRAAAEAPSAPPWFVELGERSAPAPAPPMVADRAAAEAPSAPPWYAELGGRSVPAPAPAPAPGASPGEFRLIFVHPDGSDGTSYLLRGDQIDIGRTEGDLLFEDPYLSPRHARISTTAGGQLLSVLESRNGIFLRLRAGADLKDGDVLLIGRQVLRFELVPEHERSLRPAVHHDVVQFGTNESPAWGRLLQLGPTGVSHDVFHLAREQTVIGREQADIVFADDQFMSRRHATVSLRGESAHLEDLGSSNGTFVRLRDEHLLVHGDVLRMGNVLLRFENG
jgi:pSer/pThr/pTyr-binding forkhead associated (FHA) protein